MDLEARLVHLPIFPLPSVQLFPHAILPLHVFEPRYRELLRDCLAADRVFAMAQLASPDADVPIDDGPLPVRSILGVGEVIAHESLADGRANILLHGLARARIVEELPEAHTYRVVRAQPLSDRYPAGFDLAPAQRMLLALADQLAARLPEGGDTLRGLARTHVEPGALSDVLAAALVTDPAVRLELLEELNVAKRLEALTAVLAGVLARFEDVRGPAN